MLQKVERPFNEAETAILRSTLEVKPRGLKLKDSLYPFALALGIFGLSVFAFVHGFTAVGSLERGAVTHSIWPVAMGISVVVGIVSFYVLCMVISSHVRIAGYARKFVRERHPQIRAALEDGRASVWCVDSESAILIDDLEDEDPVCIYDLGDGTSLYLRGDDYRPEDTNAPWPARHFEIVHTALDGRLLGIFSAREKLERVRVIHASEMPASFFALDEPTSESILPGHPEAVLAKLQGEKSAAL
jgi:hypothetical protein